MIRDRIQNRLNELNESVNTKPDWKAMDNVVKLYYANLNPTTGDIGNAIVQVERFIRDHVDVGVDKGYVGYGIQTYNTSGSVMGRRIVVQSELTYKNFDPVTYDAATRSYKLPKDRKEVVKALRDYIKAQNKAYQDKVKARAKNAPKPKSPVPGSSPNVGLRATQPAPSAHSTPAIRTLGMSSPSAMGGASHSSADLLEAVRKLCAAFRAANTGGHMDVQSPEMDPYGRAELSIRYWGKWEMPEGEEDDGDYDWEVLSDASYKKAREICDRMTREHKGIKFDFQTSEKNYISLFAGNAK